MNTEREAFEKLAQEMGHDLSVLPNYDGECIYSTLGTRRLFFATRTYLQALANKPEASEPIGYINLDKLKKYGMAYAYSFDVVSKSTTQHSAIYTAPPSTAALQKRIEELEAEAAKYKLGLMCIGNGVPRAHISTGDQCRHNQYGYENCDACYEEYANDFIKAGDVQAPKEAVIGYITPSDLEFPFAYPNLGYQADWRNIPVYVRIAAAPTDKEGK